jgi:adenylylsulfate kinase-like enzyme
MIYWFIGQPGCGKTTLARRLKVHFDTRRVPSIHLDGDDLRKIFGNAYGKEHFTKDYRIEWTRTLQRFVAHVADQGVNVIVSTVNPYLDVREGFKDSRPDMKEIYVTTDDVRGREHYFVEDFEPPVSNHIGIKTGGGRSEDESFQILLSYL